MSTYRTRAIIALSLLVSAAAIAVFPQGSNWPSVISPSSDPVTQGSTITYTVTFNQTDTDSTVATISTSNGSAFASIPSSITLPANQTQVSFNATTSASYSGNVTVTASANGHSANRTVRIEKD